MLNNKRLVSIVIVNWNGVEHLKKCFNSLIKIIYPKYEIILVDNGSSDDSVAFVKENYPQVKIIQNEKNLGFAEANNIGYRGSQGEYILFLSNDTTVTFDFIDHLVAEQENDENIGGIQPKILVMDFPQKLDCVGDFLTSTGILDHYGLRGDADDPKYNQKIEIFSMKGVAMFFRRKVLEEVGLFDKDFFAYFEETDLSHRVRLAGYKIVYCPESIIYHKGGGTTRNLSFNFIQGHAFKNSICSYLKNFGIWELIKTLPLYLFICQLISVFYSFKRLDPKFFVVVQKSICWNIWHIKETLEKRKKIQKDIRKIKDKEFIPYFKKKIAIRDCFNRLFTSFTFKLNKK